MAGTVAATDPASGSARRRQALDHFLSRAGAAIASRASGVGADAAHQVVGLLAAPPQPVDMAGQVDPSESTRPVMCRHLDAALAATPTPLAAAFAALDPYLRWRQRDLPGLPGCYADAPVLGENGLQQHWGLIAGVSLLAPGATYPDHHHPPEEIYLALSGGEWWNTETPWHAPGPGGIVHNPPGILHAMRGTAVPLLAIWFLLPSSAETRSVPSEAPSADASRSSAPASGR